ncbi:MAG: hypothetical protein JXX14_20630 [Deltaproteobacteria bacterium]|nr:hypothetical protein [Deltaproteobacteria bacterium]
MTMRCDELKTQNAATAKVHGRTGLPIPVAAEFVTPLCAAAVGLFALNNVYLKWAYPSVLTGKLSDFLAAFFLPLFISGLLHVVGLKRHRLRLMTGVFLIAVLFVLVKTHTGVSPILDATLTAVTAPLGVALVSNTVDPTDLMALVMLPVAFGYGAYQLKKYGECL